MIVSSRLLQQNYLWKDSKLSRLAKICGMLHKFDIHTLEKIHFLVCMNYISHWAVFKDTKFVTYIIWLCQKTYDSSYQYFLSWFIWNPLVEGKSIDKNNKLLRLAHTSLILFVINLLFDSLYKYFHISHSWIVLLPYHTINATTITI